LYRYRDKALEVFLVHPGGPYWAKRDQGAWSIPRGEYASDEDPLESARREFREETGLPAGGDFKELASQLPLLDELEQMAGK
jgi:predicted NUDIX family NTP pyrophosphohydrolase